MRSQDLAMSQIENLPGGFNALRRMYEEVGHIHCDTLAYTFPVNRCIVCYDSNLDTPLYMCSTLYPT